MARTILHLPHIRFIERYVRYLRKEKNTMILAAILAGKLHVTLLLFGILFSFYL